MLAFHDIVEPGFPEVGRFWRTIRQQYADDYEFHEFQAQYPGVPVPKLGIGLVVLRS